MFKNTEEEPNILKYEDILRSLRKDLKMILLEVYLKSRITFILVLYLRRMEMWEVLKVYKYSLRKN